MVFSSNIFLFFYLPAFLILYLCSPAKFKNLVIFIASLFFYAWGEQLLVLVMLASTAVDYFSGLIIEKGYRKTGLWLSIIINLSVLTFFKYFNFFVENFNSLLNISGMPLGGSLHFMNIALPLGISFYTFQSMSYTIEVYRGTIRATRRFIDFACYVTMFPQLVAGPIVRYTQISRELLQRKITVDNMSEGIWRFAIGLAKKVILANNIGEVADKIFQLPLNEVDTPIAWLGAICYSFQIYYDFSGYSDMAIGLGKMLGFTFPENFRQPYRSQSITEFWRRWHITLSSWFRDFVYISLGGNRKGSYRTYFNLMVVFIVTGLWHGAAWSFILWGLYHGSFLIFERVLRERPLFSLPSFLKVVLTFTVVTLGWVLFRSSSVHEALNYILIMFNLSSLPGSAFQFFGLTYFLNIDLICYLAVGALFAFTPVELVKRYAMETVGLLRLRILFSFVLLIYSAILLSTASFNPFIYFRF